MFRLILLMTSMALAGCSSIPLSTMIKFSGYEKSDFFRINPSELRIKATINSSADIDLFVATKLSAAVTDEKGKVEYHFQLEKIKVETIPAINGMFTNTPAFDVYYLKLTEQAAADFTKLKEQATSGTKKQGSFNVGVNSRKPINFENEDILFSVSLQFSSQEDYFTLIDQYQLQQPKTQ